MGGERVNRKECVDKIATYLQANKWNNASWAGVSLSSDDCKQVVPVYSTPELQGNENLKKLQQLFNNKVGKKNPLTGNAYSFNLTVRFSMESDANVYANKDNSLHWYDGQGIIPQNDELILWIVQTAAGKYKIKTILFGNNINKNITTAYTSFGSAVNWEAKTLIEKIATIDYIITDTYATILYDVLDGVASGIKWAQIPEEFYDCQKIPQYNKLYAEIFFLLDISKYFENYLIDELKTTYPNFKTKWDGVNSQQIKFAFFCGMYNGLIDVVASVPEFINLFVTPLSSKASDAVTSKFQQFAELQLEERDANGNVIKNTCNKTDLRCKAKELIKQGLYDQFLNFENKPCEVAQNIGSVIGPIVVLLIGDAAAGETVFAKLGNQAFKLLKFCDNFTDFFRYTGFAFKYVKVGAGKFFLILGNGANDVIKQISDDVFRIKLGAGIFVDCRIQEVEKLMSKFGIQNVPDFALIDINGRTVIVKMSDIVEDSKVSGFSNSLVNKLGISKNLIEELNKTYKITLTSIEKMALSEKTATQLLNVLKKIGTTDQAVIDAFIKDISNNIEFAKLFTEVGNNSDELLQIWKVLQAKDIKFARIAPKLLQKLSDLTPAAREIITDFTDKSATESTLKKFLEDIDDDFLGFINDPANEKIVKGFVAHKTLTDADYKVVAEFYRDLLAEGVKEGNWGKAKGWIERSSWLAKRQQYFDLGDKFEKAIEEFLTNINSDVYRKLKAKIPDLDNRAILKQVYFCINGKTDCTGVGEYFIADLVFVKEVEDVITGRKYLDVIIADSKLSLSTSFTDNQKVAQKLSGFAIRQYKRENIIRGVIPNGFEKTKDVVKNGDFVKIYSDGTGVFKDIN